MILINFTSVQTFIAQKAASILADKLKTRVSIQAVRIDLLNHAHIQGVYIEDHQHDTLLYAGDITVRITDWFFIKKQVPVLKYIGLENAYAHLYRPKTSADWNYQFVIDAFDTGKPKKKTSGGNNFEIDLEKVKLANVRFHMDDAWVGSDMDFDVGNVLVDANEINFKKKLIDLDKIELDKVAIQLRDYEGGRPPRAKKPAPPIDTTAFNPDKWLVKLSSLQLEDCYFGLESDTDKPKAGLFDATHMRISGINIDAKNIAIVGDTLTAKLNNLSAQDRCGLVVKKFKADVTVSPNASICKNLLLQTSRSKLQRYYAMHYTRFPDFTDYINKVVMVGDITNSTVDSRDVACFAPALKEYPTILKISGKVKGTVSNIAGKQLAITDGASVIKGNLKMKGLPDINTTYIEYENGELVTTGQGILKYAPSLKNNPNIAIEKLTQIYFKGNFIGYINNFATNSILVTNLGTVKSDIKLKMPGGKTTNSVYSGTIHTDNFALGTLLRQNDLGTVSLNAKVSGASFDPKFAQVQLNGTVDHIEYKGYNYQNINLEGSIEKNKYNGNLLINDPNLALAFYGSIDFSQKEISVNATANLLKSDFAALKLTKDSLSASADFDLNCVGSSIDNFIGYAKLYNINLLRNHHRLDIDSVYVTSKFEDGKTRINIASNVLQGELAGNFTLSKLGNSVQYYLSGYLPAYIKKPSKEAPAQDLTFNVQTSETDSLLAVLTPNIEGFSKSNISGSLNTSSQALQLNVSIPYGRVGAIMMQNVNLKSTGNFSTLTINAKADNVMVGKDIVHGSLDVKTTIGNNAMSFKIATASNNEYGTATLNGKATGHGDTLSVTLLPSEFYLNDTKWDIVNGQADISGGYLFVEDLRINSGAQTLHAYSRPDNYNGESIPTLFTELSNIDLAQLGNLAGLADYKPDGRINGKVQFDNIYHDIIIAGDIKATDVKLGDDTVGNINLSGSYNAAKNIITLDNQSGIYRGDGSLTASGNLSFDSTSNQHIVGNIQFNNTPVSWVSPFTTGLMSQLGGRLNGSVKITGIASNPHIDGNVQLSNATVRFDFLGPVYTIPQADVKLTDEKIELGTVTLYDVNKNTGTLTGYISHKAFQDFSFNLNMNSPKIEVIRLDETENALFYGNLTGSVKNLSIRDKLTDLKIRIGNVSPAEKSHLYLPIQSSSGLSTYSYITFKTYGKDQAEKKKTKNKLSISIEAGMNELGEITLVLDPSTGDAINAKGTGTIRIEMPAGNDMRMSGRFFISEGDYTFTLKQLAFKRNFKLNQGSEINFNGLLGQTQMNVEGIYTARARLYDLLTTNEKTIVDANKNDREYTETRMLQDVNILLYMKGTLASPNLTFKLDVPNKSGAGTIAYTKVQTINQNDQDLFKEVASLLLINTFMPLDGNFDAGGNVVSGSISNVSQILSSTASSQLTNIIAKLTGDESLSIDLRYKNYNYADQSAAGNLNNRNEFSFGLKKSLFNERLSVQVGSSYDWGKPVSSNTSSSNFNPVGDFKLQYLFREGGSLSGYIFRTKNYDALVDQPISRGGIGLNWSRTFNNFQEFIYGKSYLRRKAAQAIEPANNVDTANDNRDSGTW